MCARAIDHEPVGEEEKRAKRRKAPAIKLNAITAAPSTSSLAANSEAGPVLRTAMLTGAPQLSSTTSRTDTRTVLVGTSFENMTSQSELSRCLHKSVECHAQVLQRYCRTKQLLCAGIAPCYEASGSTSIAVVAGIKTGTRRYPNYHAGSILCSRLGAVHLRG